MSEATNRENAGEIEDLRPDAEQNQIAAARQLLLEYGRFVIAQPGVARFCFGELEREAEKLPMSFTDQGGGCLLARLQGEPAGFVAWRAIPDTGLAAWEMKRLWVRQSGRGHGLGRLLAQAVLDRARAAGRSAVYLDTVPESMAGAHRLYREMGFVSCERYNDNPVEGLAYLVKFLQA